MEIKLYSKVSYFVMRKKEIERETQSNKWISRAFFFLVRSE